MISLQLTTVDHFLEAYQAPRRHTQIATTCYCITYPNRFPALCTFRSDPRQELLDRAFEISPGLGLQVTVAFQEHDRGNQAQLPTSK